MESFQGALILILASCCMLACDSRASLQDGSGVLQVEQPVHSASMSKEQRKSDFKIFHAVGTLSTLWPVVIIALIIFDASQLRKQEPIYLQGDFRAQVKQIMELRQLKNENYKDIYNAVNDVETVLRSRWPDAKVIPFGSVFTGLGTPDSDIDGFVRIPNHDTNTTLTAEAASVLTRYPELFADVRRRGKRIPIVRAVHLPSHRDVDLSFTGPSSLSNTRLMKYLLNKNRTVLELAVIVKYWVKVHKLDKGITHYTFTLMVIFFLQCKGILPSIAELQENVKPLLMDHWNTAFEERTDDSASEELFDLLIEFFEYYSNFNYGRDVISPFVGYPVNRERFKDIGGLPEEFSLYKYNVENNVTGSIDLSSYIAIQEPFDHNRNVAQRVSGLMADKIIGAFKAASNVYLENNDPVEFLQSVLQEYA